MAASTPETLVRWATRWDRESLVSLVVQLAAQHGVAVTEETIGQAFGYALANPDRNRFCQDAGSGRPNIGQLWPDQGGRRHLVSCGQ